MPRPAHTLAVANTSAARIPPRLPPQSQSARSGAAESRVSQLRLTNNASARLTQSGIGPVLAGSSCTITLIPSELELLPPRFPRPAAPINIPMPYSTTEDDAPTYRGVTVTGGGTAPTADTPRRVSFNIPNEHPRDHRSHSDVTDDGGFIRDYYRRTFSQAPPLAELPALPERAENITPCAETFEDRRRVAQRAEGSSMSRSRAGGSSDSEEGTSTLEDEGDDEDASGPSGSRSQNTYHQHFRGRPSRRRCSFSQQDIEESQEDNLPFGTLPRSFEFEHEHQRVLTLHSKKLLNCEHNERVTAERYIAMMNCLERQHRIRMLFDSGRLRRHSLADFRATIELGNVVDVGDEEASTEHVENVETYPNENVQIETQEVESDDEVERLMKSDDGESDDDESDDDESDDDENVQDEGENVQADADENAQDEESRASRVFNEEDRPQLYRGPRVSEGRRCFQS
jgi:hypothetical protein